jgi:glycosyltransferase involved in cell wall biosynthesis
VSAELRRDMIREGFPASRVRVLHNGIDPGLAPTPLARAGARRALGVFDERLVIGAAGRLDPVKDFPTLIRAVARLRRDHPTAQLVIIGDGQERAALERFAADAAPDGVVFSGYRSDVRTLLPAMDLFANSSTHEGVSLTILEAMAAALPVIATRVGGTPEVVVGNETGLLVDAQNPDQLASALNTLALDPRRRRRMGEAGRLRMTARFSLDVMARAYVSAYLGGAV